MTCPHCDCAPCTHTEPLCHLAAFKAFAQPPDLPPDPWPPIVEIVSVERTEGP